jgi:N,N'-diacetylchitobiose transport system permease protein
VADAGLRLRSPRRTPRTPGAKQHRFDLMPLALLAPALALIVGLLLYPLLDTLWLSLHQVSLGGLVSGELPWAGLDNFATLLSDSFFWEVFRNTVALAIACVVLTMALGTLVALLMARLPTWARILLSLAVLVPWATPKVAATIVWKWIFDDQNGVLNWGLAAVGLHQFDHFNWFIDPLRAFAVITVLIVWQSFPFVALSMYAGLQTVPADVIEASRVDGANAWRIFWSIKVPLLRPVIAVLLILSTIWDFKVFSQVYVMTGGGPARSTYVIGLYSYLTSFRSHDFGMGAALAVVMLAVLLVITGGYIRAMFRQGELR